MIMRNVLSHLVILFSLLSVCCSHPTDVNHKNDLTEVAEKDNDMVIASKVVSAELAAPGYFDKEYFAVRKGDTSAFSCFVTKNLSTGKLSIELRTSEQKTPDTFSTADSATVSEKAGSGNIFFTDYKTQMEELKLIIRDISSEFDLDSLRHITFNLSGFPDYSKKLFEKYVEENGGVFDNSSSARVIELMKPGLLQELNMIISGDFLSINKVAVDGLAFAGLPGRNNMLYGSVICEVGLRNQ